MSMSYRTVKLIFYSPIAEMVESQKYVDQMTYWMKFNRLLADKMNAVNANYRTHTLEIDDLEATLKLVDLPSPDSDSDVVTTSFERGNSGDKCCCC